jgi:uncharacterized protein YndB with AHSA1/START domain
MNDYQDELKATRRTVDGYKVTLERTYDTSIEDVWDAVTDPERIARWFLPITGDLRLGGRYQLQGNAGGEILACDPPRMLRVTWVFGDSSTGSTEVRLNLSTTDGGETRLELAHSADTVPPQWDEFGPGAVGVGWDLTVLGLALHLRDPGFDKGDGMAWMGSPEGKSFITISSDLWGEATVASGEDADRVATMVANTTKAYTGG